jgi:integrase
MGLTIRGKVWYYDFQKGGKRYQASTGCTNKNKAREVEAKIKTDVTMSRFGIAPQKQCPTLSDFLNGPFLQHVRQHNGNPRTARLYREKVRRLLDWPRWREARLHEIEDLIPAYIDWRSGLANDTINAELRTLRKAMILAEEQKLAPRVRVKLLKPSKGRKFVLSGELENEYLEAASYPLKQAAILILDLGLRPLECVNLKKTDITTDNLMVWDGKSGSRPLPLTERAREVIQFLCHLHPDSPWLLPSPYDKRKHMARSTLTNRHIELRDQHPDWPRELMLYSGRHTFGTRLAESSGGNPFEIKALMGHTSVRTSEKYVHTTTEELSLAMKRKERYDRMMRGEEAPAEIPTTARKSLTMN